MLLKIGAVSEPVGAVLEVTILVFKAAIVVSVAAPVGKGRDVALTGWVTELPSTNNLLPLKVS